MPHQLVKKYHTNDPFKLAKYLNINMRFESLPKNVQGFYYRVLRRRFIVIDTALSEELKRFVCAHELAHDRLHKSLNRYFIMNQTLFKPSKFEIEADTYAIQLLACGTYFDEEETCQSFYNRIGIPDEVIQSLGNEHVCKISNSIANMKCIHKN